MQLWDWLTEHDIRLDVRMESEMDPQIGLPEWHCEILGFPSPNALRPAVFILEFADGPESLVEGFDPDPGAALREAVRQLRGKTISVIYRERDEQIVVPQDLTV